MEIFLSILYKIIPLYGIILLGFIAAKKLQAQRETVANLLIYIIAPAVIFYGAYTAEVTLTNLSLPLLFFCLSSATCLLFLFIGGFIFKESSLKNILAFTAGTGNTGYFGLPVIAAMLGEQAFSLAVLSILGFVLYENSIGFFVTARGSFTLRESLIKVAKLPTIYAFFLGIALNIVNVDFGDMALTTVTHFRGAYTLLGMMLIGIGLSGASIKNFDYKFLSLTFLAKFIFWPLLIALVIFVDKSFFLFYTQEVYDVLIIMSVVPLAANTVALATVLKAHPEKAAVAVMLSTLFALFYIPLIGTLFVR